MSEKKPITVIFPPDQVEQLKQRAVEGRTTVSTVVRQAVDHYLAANNKRSESQTAASA